MTKVLLFSGQIGSGKGYVSSQRISKLKEVGNTIVQLSFANPIKKIVDDICGYDKNIKPVRKINHTELSERQFSNLIYDSIKEKVVDEIHEFFNGGFYFKKFTEEQKNIIEKLYKLYQIVRNRGLVPEIRKESIRQMYQLFGTELCQPINKTIWSVYASAKISNLCFENDVDYVVIDDFRFIMEYFSMIALLPQYEIIPYAIIADKEIRAKRRNISVEELDKMCEHLSEREFDIIFQWMRLRLPENIIENN